MSNFRPLVVSERGAAHLLSVRITDFRNLVAQGCVPPGRELAPGVTRWSVEELSAFVSGKAVQGLEDVNW
jgi:hypothetical protein